MTGFLLGIKSKQSQMYDSKGALLPVTVIDAASCKLVDIKTKEKNGYTAVKLASGIVKSLGRSVFGQLKKAGITDNYTFIREVRIKNDTEFSVVEESGKKGIRVADAVFFMGEKILPSKLFKIGDVVDITGISKGKGFQGVVKRHHFAGGPKTHGQSDRQRAPGSVGPNTTPGHVFRGTRMAGQMGNKQSTIKNLMVVGVDETSLTVRGLIPGHIRSFVKVKSVRSK